MLVKLVGDGYGDVIVGAVLYDLGEGDEGAAFVFLGNDNTNGRPVLARQRGGYSYALKPVQPWGISWDWPNTSFVAELRADHPDGIGRRRSKRVPPDCRSAMRAVRSRRAQTGCS